MNQAANFSGPSPHDIFDDSPSSEGVPPEPLNFLLDESAPKYVLHYSRTDKTVRI